MIYYVMRKKNQQIINLRGIAIILVLLGHSIIIYDNSFKLLSTDIQMPFFETLKHWISFVQMKLFISISGFLMAFKCLKDDKETWYAFEKSKLIRLLVPYVCVLLLYNDPLKWILKIPGYQDPFSFLTDQILGVNCAHLWYLVCLFILFSICYPLFRWAGKTLWKHVMLFTAFLGINYYSGAFPQYYQLNEVAYYFVFFHIGYLVNYCRQIYSTQLEYINKTLTQLILLACIVIIGYVIKLITSIGFDLYLSIVILLLLYKFIPSFDNSIINNISKRSYGLYLFHSPMIYITAVFCPDINPWFMLFINFVCFGLVAYFITTALSKSRMKFLIGE